MTVMGWILLAIAGIALAGFATFEAVKSSVPDSAQQELHESEPRGRDENAQPNPEEKQKETEKSYMRRFFKTVETYEKPLLVISTVLIAIFTVVLALATFFLWRSTRDLVRGAENTAERQLRAYVFVKSMELRYFGTTRPFEVAARVKNSGQTPAYHLRTRITATLAVFPIKEFVSAPPTPGESILGPSDELEISNVSPRTLTADERGKTVNGEYAIYVYGEIDYVDAFGRTRHTRFRGIYRGVQLPPPENSTLTVAQTAEGNEAD